MAEYRINQAKKKLEAGGVVTIVNGVNDGDTAEIFGNLGFEIILAEGEHGPISWDSIGDISRACDLWDMCSMVRVHRNDPSLITRALDHRKQGRSRLEKKSMRLAPAKLGSSSGFQARSKHIIGEYESWAARCEANDEIARNGAMRPFFADSSYHAPGCRA